MLIFSRKFDFSKELLEVYFNSEDIYNESDKEKIIEFYKNKIILENRVIRIAETELKKRITESIKKCLKTII